jgi:hypothetical protein
MDNANVLRLWHGDVLARIAELHGRMLPELQREQSVANVTTVPSGRVPARRLGS